MSLELHAFLVKRSVPLRTQWQAAITELGFGMQIDPKLERFTNSGFVPCKLAVKDSGFEIYYDPADELLTAYPHIKDKIAERDYSISFRWGSDMSEYGCIAIASAALAKSFNALIYYPSDDLFFGFDDLILEAKYALDEMK